MNILVTGCAGFIGFHLCKRLLEEGNLVIGMDNFASGSKANIEALSKYDKFNFNEHDVGQSLDWLDFIKIDQIFHLASIASPPLYTQNPFSPIVSNTMGTLNCLRLARRNQAAFLFTSTSEVYGDPLQHPQSEAYYGNVNCYGPRSCYDESKRLGETIIYEFRRLNPTDTKIVRIFNTYGPHMNLEDGRVIIEFIRKALKNEPLVIFGSGDQTRSFCYVDDLVEGLLKMIRSREEGPINLGNDVEEWSIRALATKIIKLTGSSSPIIYREAMQNDPVVRRPDLTKAKGKLGYENLFTLDEGLKRTIEWVRSLDDSE